MAEAPTRVVELVEAFERNIEVYRSQQYNETQLRREFIDPFFEELGWDVTNKLGYAQAYKDVIHEDAIKVGGATKAPDYCFRIGGVRKFFVEAKKPSVDIKGDVHPAYQLRRYAWSAKLPLSILTDFEEFAVYDCQRRPKPTDKAGTARIMYFTYNDYIKQWDRIADVFSKEAVLKGSFDKFVTTTKAKRGTTTVDKEFLAEIEKWRKMLAKIIALRNSALSRQEINFAVQRTIDRILFLRMCEDRGIEPYGQLRAISSGDRTYPRLCEIFEKADQKYNSGLFHFSDEPGRAEPPDRLTLNLVIDDKDLKWILHTLYYPQSPYEFSVLPAEILGNVYEQFLGKVISVSPARRVKIETKPEVKKAGGIFYTPSYIVDYIVKNTVGKLCEGKTPRQISKLKILDPACGSGSFLLGAYTYLLNYHRDWYVDHDPAKYTKQIYQGKGGQWFLTIAEKKKILLNNIFGVDIDSQAVEVTKLSLLLKVLEGENQQTLENQYRLFHERALPDLANNIKCGNSLIGPDFYDNFDPDSITDELRDRINAFDWQAEFPEIFNRKNPGFDAVIGNPPYVRQETIREFKQYFQKHYAVYHSIADLYTYFIEKAITNLNKGGYFSYIVANKWLRASYAEPLRLSLKNFRIEQIIDFGDLPVFQSATTYPCILVISKNSPSKYFTVTQIKTLDFQDLSKYIDKNNYPVNQEILSHKGWSLTDEKTQALLQKLHEKCVSLEQYVGGKIYRGILTGLNKAFVIDKETRDILIKKDKKSEQLFRPFIFGRDVKRYHSTECERFLIFMPFGWTKQHLQSEKNPWSWLKSEYPAIAEHLTRFASAGQKRYDKGQYWWELRACDFYAEFETPKIIYPNICKRPEFTFDDEGLFTNQKCFILPLNDKYLLGILNSSLTYFLFHETLPKLRGGFHEPSYVYFSKFPIYKINSSNPKEKAKQDKMVKLVERMLDLHKQLAAVKIPDEKTRIQRQIDITDKQIDKLVYDLYSLSDEEIKIVEEGM